MELRQEIKDWLEGRPQVIKDSVTKCPPDREYINKPTGQICQIVSYSENGTVTINIVGHKDEFLDMMNKMIPLQVFGVHTDDLEAMPPPPHEDGR